MNEEQRRIKVLAEHKPGVLMRIANILTAKGVNIEQVSVAPERRRAGMSKIVVTANLEPRFQLRVVNEMNRLVNVVSAIDITKKPKARIGIYI